MTKREAAIVSAYTGYLIREFSDFHAYAEEILGRPVFTHELPYIMDGLKEKSKKDFMSIQITEEPPEWLYHTPFEEYSWVDFDAVEKALGFRLFSWHKEYIDIGCGYADRRTGKTTAMILRHLLSVEEKPIDFSRPAPSKHVDVVRHHYRDIWEKLRDAGIPMRPVFWNKEDKEFYEKELNKFDPYKYAREAFIKYEADNHNHTCSDCSQFRYDRVNGIYHCSRRAFGNIYQAEEMSACDDFEKGEQSNVEPTRIFSKVHEYLNPPDCNDCGYLNYTEKEQRDYGINSYKKDHRCKCYDRPVYHQTNSTKHDPYIYPCEECREDNFVNYYDCESSKKGE